MTENDAIKEIETSLELAEMCEPNREREKEIKAYKIAIQSLQKVQQFESIGTIEEFKSLKEKSVAKKPIRSDLCTCPSCGTHNEIIKKRRNTVTFDTVYCWYCGQAIEITCD